MGSSETHYKVAKYRVSVIIPAYNAETIIRECLSSLINQSIRRDKYEIIVVDDGSTDRTNDIAKEFGARVLYQKNAGPAAARNRGAQEAESDILLFIDSDCIPNKGWIEKMIEPFSNPEIVGVQGIYMSKQKNIIARLVQTEIEHRYSLMQRSKYIDFIGTYAAAYKKNIFLKMGGFDISFPMASGEDTDLSYRLSQNDYKMVFNPQAIVYHKHPDTLKSYLRQKYWRAYWRNLIYKKNPHKAIKDSYTPQILKIQIFIAGIISLSLFSIPFGLDLKVTFLLFMIFIISSFPFMFFSFKNGIIVGLLSPAFLFMRTCAFLSGMINGFIKEVVLRK